MMADETMKAEKDDKEEQATFVVHVKYQQNTTWQGSIQWLDLKRSQQFRSTLELIKLMDEALMEHSGGEYTTWNTPLEKDSEAF